MLVITVNIEKQILQVSDAGQIIHEYPVSTSAYGIGNQDGSFKTPVGHHRICEKIGQGMPVDEVFIGRQAKGRLEELRTQEVTLPEDIITARILRLKGQEPGVNQGKGIDSFERYIYIHGTADEEHISEPVSHGCVRMKNQDIVALFELVDIDTDVWIEA